MPRLAKQIAEAIEAFKECGVMPALIGGLALAAHEVVRATQDVDFLADADDAAFLHRALTGMGYTCRYRSEDAANYVRNDEGLDLLYARRPAARRLLTTAESRSTPMGQLRVVSAEGLIGFKLQALANNPRRTQDLEDIRALFRVQHARLDMQEVRDYFVLFHREALLDELIAQSRHE